METKIVARNVALSEAQKESAENRLQFTLGRFGSQIETATLTLTDVDGPKSGTDILCRLKVILKKGGEVLVGDTDVSVEAAIANVANRGARSVARALDLQRDQTRASMAHSESNRP